MTYISQQPLDVCPLGNDFTGDYAAVNTDSQEYKILFNELLLLNHHNAVQVFRTGKKDFAIKLLDPYMAESLEKNYYQPDVFNDYGYFLQQAGENGEAIKYLTIVKDKSPKRTVVYLNLADSYWGDKNEAEAIRNYKQYISMMNSTGNGKKIPARAIERAQ